MKKFLSVALLAAMGFGANFTVMPYGAYINYSKNSLKKHAYTGGFYTAYFKFPMKLELDAQSSAIEYRNNIPDWDQQDVTLVGHYYIGRHWDVKLGIHNIFIEQNNNPDNYDKVFLGGISYYKYLKYNMGVDYYYSSYDHFHVNQITPKFGINFGNYYSAAGSFYFETKVNYIKISGNSGAKKDNYTNVGMKLQNYHGKWMTELHGNVGDNAYKVAKDGFVVYNLGEEYKNSAGIAINYYISRTVSFKAGFDRSEFETNNKNAFSNVYSISFIKYF